MARLNAVRHHLMVLLRGFRREKLYTAINIAGLALGFASCLLLGLFLYSELTYDRYYPNHRNIYRVANEFITNGKAEPMVMSADALGPMMVEEYPAKVLGYVRLRPFGNNGGAALRRPDQPDKVFYWKNSYIADDNLFEVFPVEVVYGDPHTALVQGSGVAISQRVAEQYFGDENPIGKPLVTDLDLPTVVTLVFREQPANTHLKYDLVFSYNQPFLQIGDTPARRRQRLVAINGFTYLVMHPSFKLAEWQGMSRDFTEKYMGDDLRAAKIEWRSWLQPLASTHMQTEAAYDLPNGNAAYLHGCAAVALVILLVACINYMNLATARAARRARSVAVRKILGASRRSLAAQFMAEALLFTLVALLVAVALVEVVLRFTPIASLFDHQVTLDLLRHPAPALWLLAMALAVGVLAGLYPALYLSSWAPLTALTGTHRARGNPRMREFLVLVQFTISAATMACTMLMVAQMHYVTTRPLGFEREHRLLVTVRGASTIESIPAIRNALLADASIRGVAVAETTPADGNGRVDFRSMQIEGEDGAMHPHLLGIQRLGEDYEKVMGLQLVQGRDLASRLLTDVGPGVLVNEAMVRQMGWTRPIGKRVQTQGPRESRVVGVVRDFHFKTLHHRIEPLVMTRLSNDLSRLGVMDRAFEQRQLILDLSAEEIPRALAHAQRVMEGADPKHPFEYRFLDESLRQLYGTELSLTRLMGLFAAISVFIACLGLFGLSAFTIEQRAREIGTRKVLGATAWQIVVLLARRILVLVLLASVLAGVAAYFAVDEWLQGFAYRAGINPLVFLLATGLAAAVAFATVAAQSWRTANADPVQALRQA